MKTIINTLFLLLLFTMQIQSQSVVATAGTSDNNSSVMIDWTIGEVLVQSHDNGSVVLEEGFNQALQVISTSVRNTLDIEIGIYPIPTADRITIDFESEQSLFLQMTDLSGKSILSKEIISGEAINFSNYTQGTYLITLNNLKGQQSTYKVVKN